MEQARRACGALDCTIETAVPINQDEVPKMALGTRLKAGAATFFKTLAFTLIPFSGAGVLLAFLVARQSGEAHSLGIVLSVVAFSESVVIGAVLGVKSGLVKVIIGELERHSIGSVIGSQLFERMLGITEGGDFMNRGGKIARGVERLPLAQAERKLRDAIGFLGRQDDEGTPRQGVAGWVYRALLSAVEKYTLSRFRDAAATSGGVDLEKAKELVERSIDGAIIAKLRSGLNLWRGIAVLGLPVLVFAQTALVHRLVGR